MKIIKAIFKIFSVLAKIFVVIAAVNFVFSYIVERKHRKIPEGGKFYHWKHGKVFYHKRGKGSPLILLHGFEPSHSGKDVETLSGHLSTNHTVYRIDLPGFGLSDKPWLTYTNYLYVLLIQDFIKNVIGDITDIVACGGSGLCALQAFKDDPSIIGKIVLVDPCYSESLKVNKAYSTKLKQLIDLPIIGTFIYNIYSLTGSSLLDKEGRHVFTSRMAGYLTTDLTGHEDLITPDVAVFNKADDSSGFTFGDVKTSLV